MTKDKISRIYAIIHLLEAHLAMEHFRLTNTENVNPLSLSKQAQYQDLLTSMRRLANQLQLQVASEDFEAAARSESIFRGYQSMLGPEVLVKIKKAGLEPLPIHSDAEVPSAA